MIKTYTSYTLEQFFCPSYGLVEPPTQSEFKVNKAKMTFELNG